MSHICYAKHTVYQPPKPEWICPSCGASGGTLTATPDPEALVKCDRLHENDVISCSRCGSTWTGKQFASLQIESQDSKPSQNRTISVDAYYRLVCFIYMLVNYKLPYNEVVELVNAIVDADISLSDKNLSVCAEKLLDRLINQKS